MKIVTLGTAASGILFTLRISVSPVFRILILLLHSDFYLLT